MVMMAMMMIMGKLFYYVSHDKSNSVMTYDGLLLKRYLGVHRLRSIVLSNHTRAAAAL